MNLHRTLTALLVLPRVQSELQGSLPPGLRGVLDAIAGETERAGRVDDARTFIRIGAVGEKKKKSRRHKKERSNGSASAFGTALFADLCARTAGNVLLSPLSVHRALTLVKNGATAGSDNARQLARVLGPPSLVEQTEEDSDAGVTLRMASSVWANDLKPSYVEGVAAADGGGAFPLPETLAPIDGWVEDQTDGMIKSLLGDGRVEGGVVALLVNAVYFKGAWTHSFDPAKTTDGEFILRDGSTRPARFMAVLRQVPFVQSAASLGGAIVVALDYGNATAAPSEFTSLFVLPRTSSAEAMRDTITGLNSEPIPALLEEAVDARVDLRLPRFRLAGGQDAPVALKPSLERMGVTDAFDPHVAGKFDAMSGDPTLTLEDVLHGAVLEVMEAGTEAAGATVAPEGQRMRHLRTAFDRPFVVAVVHRATGTPVFICRVEEPELLF